MKSFKSFIGVLAAINVLGAIACLVIMFVSKSTGDAFWPTYIPVSVSLFVNAIVFAFIDDLAGRVDKIEEILKVKGITLEELNKKPEPKEQQTVFRPGEPIKLKNKIEINGKTIEENSSGMVITKHENNDYTIELDEDRGNLLKVSGADLKSFFDK